MNRSSWQAFLSSLVVFGIAGFSPAGIIVDQPPGQGGGPSSDTLFQDFFGDQIWQREADNFQIANPAIIESVNWWGFYGGEDQAHTPPLGDESFRIRIYTSRSDGLPDETEILCEETFLNLSRQDTGKTIAVQGRPVEYFYQAELGIAVPLPAGQLLWLEIVQLGDANSHFRWESGIGQMPGHSFVSYLVSDWRLTSGSFAFQLVAVPEPSTAAFSMLGLSLLLKRARNLRLSRVRLAR